MPRFENGIAGIFRPLLIFLVFFLGFPEWKPMAVAQDHPAPLNEISVAVGQDYAPCCFRDHEGRADGWLVDIWRLWSRKTGVKVNFVSVPFSETLKLTEEQQFPLMALPNLFFSFCKK